MTVEPMYVFWLCVVFSRELKKMPETIKKKYLNFLPKFVSILPMNDAMFCAGLATAGLFPGNTFVVVTVQQTREERALKFLRECIEPGFFMDDNSNDSLDRLLSVMEESYFEHVKDLAKQFKNCKWLLYIF